MDAMGVHRSRELRSRASGPVLQAASIEALHVMGLYALGADLAERRVPAVRLGVGLLGCALACAARRTGASAIFLCWARECIDEINLQQFRLIRPRVRIVTGRSGWMQICRLMLAMFFRLKREYQCSRPVPLCKRTGLELEIGLQQVVRVLASVCMLSIPECGD